MSTLASLIGNAGRDNTDFTYFTQEQQEAFWAAVDDGGTKFAQEIVDYMMENGATDVASAAAGWNYPDLPADATATDFFEAIAAAYDWNFSACEAETAGTALSELIPEDVYAMGTQGVETGEAAPNVEGIVRVDDHNMSVVTNGVDATMIYQLGINPCSMKYYGDESLYDFENNQFGFTKGDLSKARGLNGSPMGSGAYVFDDYTSGTVHMSANENYYKGAPKTAHLNIVESQEADMVTGVQAGTLDISQPSYSMEVEEQIKEINGNDSTTGDVISTFLHDYRGYGYMAISANKVNVGGDPASDASKALRKAICTVIAPFRDSGIRSYYGDTATTLNYPISTSSWASPNETDPGYAVCFSTDALRQPALHRRHERRGAHRGGQGRRPHLVRGRGLHRCRRQGHRRPRGRQAPVRVQDRRRRPGRPPHLHDPAGGQERLLRDRHRLHRDRHRQRLRPLRLLPVRRGRDVVRRLAVHG